MALSLCVFYACGGTTGRTNVETSGCANITINNNNAEGICGTHVALRQTFGARNAIFVGAETPEEQETSPALSLIQGPLPLPMTYNVADRCPFPESIQMQQHSNK